MIEQIFYQKKLYAIIVRNKFSKAGANFITNPKISQQLAHMKYKKGHQIKCHYHKKWKRMITTTMEVLFIKKGKLKVNFYTVSGKFFLNKILSEKDTILFIYGGHGFEVIRNVSMIEVKQGPFTKDTRKFLPSSIAIKKVKNKTL